MGTLESLLREYGYGFVFAGSLLEGETTVALAGLAAHRGYLELLPVIVVATLGATLGDQIWFHVGRARGVEFLESRPEWRSGVARFESLLQRFDIFLILAFRFLYGMRLLGAVAMGTSPLGVLKFTILNFLGAVLWANLVAFGGYFLGQAIEALLGNIAAYEEWIFLGIVVIGAGFGGLRTLKRRRRAAKPAN